MSLGRRAAIQSHEVFRDADDSGKVEVLVHDKDFLFGAAAETVLIAWLERSATYGHPKRDLLSSLQCPKEELTFRKHRKSCRARSI